MAAAATYVHMFAKCAAFGRTEIEIFEIVFGGLTIGFETLWSDSEVNFDLNCIKFVKFNDNLDVNRNSH